MYTYSTCSGWYVRLRPAALVPTPRVYLARCHGVSAPGSPLEELGIPIVAECVRFGNYALVPGFKLPPLVFSCGRLIICECDAHDVFMRRAISLIRDTAV